MAWLLHHSNGHHLALQALGKDVASRQNLMSYQRLTLHTPAKIIPARELRWVRGLKIPFHVILPDHAIAPLSLCPVQPVVGALDQRIHCIGRHDRGDADARGNEDGFAAEGEGMGGHALAQAVGDFGDETPPRLPVPILLIHGLADDVVPVAGGMSPTRLVARGQTRPFLPLRDTLAFWRRADGCTGVASPGRTAAGRLETYGPCADQTSVALLTLADGGHAWPSDATDKIWSFFTRFRR